MPQKSFWKNKNVFITGHTGFKGTWLCLWLKSLGARVTGFSLDIPTKPSLYNLTKPDVRTIWGDVRDLKALKKSIKQEKPAMVFHLAAQSLVGASYTDPVATFETNILGTVNVLEALRGSCVKAAVMVTTDKVYENKEDGIAFKESDRFGGDDPYSASKGASEIIIASYRKSFFNPQEHGKLHSTLIASVRSGNTIGGGDFASDRLVPDVLRSFLADTEVIIRNPYAVRPWQHVLESLSGYLLLGEKLYNGQKKLADAFNFGPEEIDVKSVEWLVKAMSAQWGKGKKYKVINRTHSPEMHYLRLDITKAKKELGFKPRWNIDKAIAMTLQWTRAYQDHENMRQVCENQIKAYAHKSRSLLA